MAQGFQKVNKAFGRPEVISVPKNGTVTGAVTVASDLVSTERVWVSTNPLVCVYPWLGTPVAPGATASISVPPAPMGAVSASVTVA